MINQEIKRGDIFLAKLPKNDCEKSQIQHGVRPVIVLSNDKANKFSPVIHITPLTSKMTKNNIPTHVTLKEDCGIERESIALVEQSQLIDKSNLIHHIGHCTDEVIVAIDKAIEIQFKGFSHEYVTELIETITSINNLIKRLKDNNILIHTSELRTKNNLINELKEYCEGFNIDYMNIVKEYKQKRKIA
jgi:mRNA interferase MazF